MPTPQERLDLDRIVNTVDAPIVIAIIIDENGMPETLTKGVADDRHWFMLLHQLAKQAGVLAYNSLTPEEKARMTLVLPTNSRELMEDARRMGILKKNGRIS
jgi:hypothetical protein